MPVEVGTKEAVLLYRAQILGDVTAFSNLVRIHQSAIRSFLIRLCKNYDLADDIAQDAFIIAFKKLKTYHGRGKFVGWLMKIAYNCFLQRLRKHKRDVKIMAEYATITDIDSAYYDDITPEQIDLEQAMLKLTLDESAAITLCHSFGFSHTEVAGILQSPLGTVKSNISRGKLKLRKLLSTDLSETVS